MPGASVITNFVERLNQTNDVGSVISALNDVIASPDLPEGIGNAVAHATSIGLQMGVGAAPLGCR